MRGVGCEVQGLLGCMVWGVGGSGTVQGMMCMVCMGCWVCGARCEVHGMGCMVWGTWSVCDVHGAWCEVQLLEGIVSDEWC